MKKYVIYIRVSTQKQADTNLGLSAQESICRNYINSVNGCIDRIFQDVESGKSRTRVGLWQAIEHCQKTDSTLVIAKLDRLARDVEFTFKVINTGIDIHFCDMPVVNSMILGVFASVAQYERELCSTRTKSALEVKKKQGVKLGRPKGCEASQNAIRASAESRRNVAIENPNNKRFYSFMNLYEQKNGAIDRNTDISAFVKELNYLGYKTSTGLDFDNSRTRAMIKNVRKLYAPQI